jgi:hypothetical protein
MARQIVISRKKRGPPPTGKGTPILVRIQPKNLKTLDGWIASQTDKPSRPEAIRRIVEMALSGASSGKVPNKASARKAAHLAASKLDDLTDKSLPADTQAMAKRRLLEGPKEFRGIRRDQKTKR